MTGIPATPAIAKCTDFQLPALTPDNRNCARSAPGDPADSAGPASPGRHILQYPAEAGSQRESAGKSVAAEHTVPRGSPLPMERRTVRRRTGPPGPAWKSIAGKRAASSPAAGRLQDKRGILQSRRSGGLFQRSSGAVSIPAPVSWDIICANDTADDMRKKVGVRGKTSLVRHLTDIDPGYPPLKKPSTPLSQIRFAPV